MDPITLHYQENPQAKIPELVDPSGRFSREQLQAWEKELAPRYQELSRGEKDQEVSLPHRGGTLRFRVMVHPRRGKRCPDIILKQKLESASSKPTVKSPTRAEGRMTWPKAFVAQLERLSGKLELDRAEKAGWEFVVAELHQLAEARSQDFMLLLLAGYLQVAAHSNSQHNPERVGLYTLAGRVVEELCAASLPEEDLGGLGKLRTFWKSHWVGKLIERLLPSSSGK